MSAKTECDYCGARCSGTTRYSELEWGRKIEANLELGLTEDGFGGESGQAAEVQGPLLQEVVEEAPRVARAEAARLLWLPSCAGIMIHGRKPRKGGTGRGLTSPRHRGS